MQHHVVIILCIFCILTTITAVFMDTTAAYMLHRTDFSLCLHTGDSRLVVDCDTSVCADLHLPPNTCYCCHLYQERKAKGCETPFLMDKQAFFKGVDSCSVLPDRLSPLLITVGLLCLASTALNLLFLFKSRPVRYYVKSEKGGGEEEEEVEEGDLEVEEEGEEVGGRGRLIKLVRKWRAKRADIRYSAANTEETNIDD